VSSRKKHLIISALCLSSAGTIEASQEPSKLKIENLCSGVEFFDTAPDRPLKFGHEINLLLLLTKPFIATNAGDGIFSRWQFSAKGNELLAEISGSATWNDGTQVTPLEAASGIIAGLRNRAIGKNLKLKGQTNLPSFDEIVAKQNQFIRLIDDKTFGIEFDGDIQNIQGVVREALSANSRINRVWPIKISNGTRGRDIVSKNKIDWSKNDPEIFLTENHRVRITNSKTNCTNAEYYLSSALVNSKHPDLESQLSPQQQMLFAVINPTNPEAKSVQQRKKIIASLKNDLLGIQNQEFALANEFFERGEPGSKAPNDQYYGKNLRITDSPEFSTKIKIQPWTKIPDGWKVRQHLLSKENKYEFGSPDESSLPVLLAAAPVNLKGQQISLQNGTIFARINQLKSFYPKTFSALLALQQTSSATLPKDQKLFANLQDAAGDEHSIAPLLRFRISLISNKNSLYVLKWSDDGEIEISKRRNK
jgi:hypothetical protein